MESSIVIIDVGPAHKGLLPILREQVYASECRRRKVRFLPAQVVRRLVAEIKFDEGTGMAINPFETSM